MAKSKSVSKPSAKQSPAPTKKPSATPMTGQRGPIIQEFGDVVKMPIGLEHNACKTNVENLNQILADTITPRDMYKKHHWQVSGHTFYQLHLLFDKHAEEQTKLVDEIAERIQLLVQRHSTNLG